MSVGTHEPFIFAADTNRVQIIFSLKALPGNEELNDATTEAKKSFPNLSRSLNYMTKSIECVNISPTGTHSLPQHHSDGEYSL